MGELPPPRGRHAPIATAARISKTRNLEEGKPGRNTAWIALGSAHCLNPITADVGQAR
jgi:hypothetical protein